MGIKRIEAMLSLIGAGKFLDRLHAELNEELQNLEDHVNSENADATLSLTIKVDFKLCRDGSMQLKGDTVFKRPKMKAFGGVAWLDNGELSPQNPAQLNMDLTRGSAPVRGFVPAIEEATEIPTHADIGYGSRTFAD